jgi:glycosyltransferase involved in cell wall biosynthesis
MDDSKFPFRVVRRPGLRDLVRHIRSADLLHLAGAALLPLTLARLLGTRAVVEHHGFQVACPTGLLFYEPEHTPCPGYFMARQYGKCIKCQSVNKGYLRSLTGVVFTKVRRFLSDRVNVNIMPTAWLGSVLKLKRMRTIHHGIPDGSGQIASTPSTATFAYHGRMVSTKGVKTLIEAAKILKARQQQFHIKLIGDGPDLASVKSESLGLGENVKFLGYVPDDKLEEALGDVATIVMPSLGGEVFGLVAAENMLRGKLLIVSDAGSLAEVVGEAGLIFRAGDAEELAGCMEKVLQEPWLAASLGRQAHDRVGELFNLDGMIQKHLQLYKQIARL